MLPIYTTDYYQNFVVKGSQGRRDYNDSINDSVRMMDSLPLDHWTYQPDVELRNIPHPTNNGASETAYTLIDGYSYQYADGVTVNAHSSLDLLNVDFYRLYEGSLNYLKSTGRDSYQFFYRDQLVDFGLDYESGLALYQSVGSTNVAAGFGGSSINSYTQPAYFPGVGYGEELIITGGDIQWFGEGYMNNYGNITPWYEIFDIPNYPAVKVFDAIRSSSKVDDQNVMEQIPGSRYI